MLARAHITVGLAAAFTVMMPENMPEALPVVAGASLGCLICDLDCENNREKTDSSRWRRVMAAITAAALIEDYLLGAGMWKSIGGNGRYLWCVGLAGLVLTCTFASISKHRGFSHSLSALLLETAFLWMIFPAVAEPFALAFISHIVLDLTNKKSVRLLYPARKGFSFGWFYADRLANTICAAAGTVWLAAAVFVCFRQ